MVGGAKAFRNGLRVRHWLVLAGIGLTLPLGVSQALGADPGLEAEPAGPPACSVVAANPQFGGVGIDFWLQCNYHVRRAVITSSNRRLFGVSRSPELVGAGPQDTMGCRMGRHRRVICEGGLTAFARIHAQIGLEEPICEKPYLHLSVETSGGPQCTGNCPGIEFRSLATNAIGSGKVGCLGG
jgi:hypothetical protein